MNNQYLDLIDRSNSILSNEDIPLNSSTYSYAKNITWGGDLLDEAQSIAVDIENNKIIVGSTESYGAGNKDIIILKYDENDSELWNKTWGGVDIDEAFKVTTDENCNIYVVGRTNSIGNGNADVIFLKYSKQGILIWNKTWGGLDDDIASAINVHMNGDFYITGKTKSFGSEAFDVFLLKYNSSGDFQWARYWGATYDDVGMAIDFDSNGQIYIAGYHYYLSNSIYTIILLKYTEAGGLLRSSGIGGGGHWFCYDMKCQNNILYVVGCQNARGNGGYDTFLYAFNTNLEKVWGDRIWGGSGDDRAYGIEISISGSIFLAGKTNSFGSGNYDYFLAYYDVSHTQKWVNYWGGFQDDICYDVALDYSNNVWLYGYTESFSSGLADICGVKYNTMEHFPIYIDDMDSQFNWNRTALLYDWCSGNGTKNNPYVIENLTINGEGGRNCIDIRNSNAFFTIKNCTLYNSGYTFDLFNPQYRSAISLSYVSNGYFNNLTCTPDNGHGVYMEFCANLTLVDIYASYNYWAGLWMSNSDHNNISGIIADHIWNDPNLPEGMGIRIYDSEYNQIFNSSASYCEETGVSLIRGQYNLLSGMTLNHNPKEGMYLRSQYTNITNSVFKYNNEYGLRNYHQGDYCNIIGNTFSYNRFIGILFEAIDGYSAVVSNTIANNTFEHGNFGLTLRGDNILGCDNHLIVNNTFRYNNFKHISLSNADNNNFWGNSFIGTHPEVSWGPYPSVNNNWNNSQYGNYWDNYPGVDENDDGIGDTPYNITEGIDYLPLWWDGPNFTIITPRANQVYSMPPEFQIDITDPWLDTMWYTLDLSSKKHIFQSNGTINITAWSDLSDGNIVIRFYANDTFGNTNYEEVNVIKDTAAPQFTLLAPIDGNAYDSAPDYNILISDPNFNLSWYIINSGIEKYFFSSSTGTLNTSAWDILEDGTVTIIFYANDSSNQVNFLEIEIIKDTTAPEIIIYDPKNGDVFSSLPVRINVSISDVTLYETWYQVNDLSYKHHFTGSTPEISLSTWDSLPEGNFTITIYASDSLGRITSVSIEIIKDLPEDIQISGYHVFIFLEVIFGITIIVFLKTKKSKIKKNRVRNN